MFMEKEHVSGGEKKKIIQGGAPLLAKLVQISPITRFYGGYI